MTGIAAACDSGLVIELGRRLRVDVGTAEAGRLARYAGLVSAWNARIDLTAAREPAAIVEVLCADAMMLTAEALVPRGAHVVDVGSGAGAPGLALVLLRADVTATLVEPLRKRVVFLRTAIGDLDLAARVRVVEARVDERAPKVVGGPFDVALSRATFPAPQWIPMGLALAPRAIAFTAAGPAPSPPPGARVDAHVDYALPSNGAPRALTRYVR